MMSIEPLLFPLTGLPVIGLINASRPAVMKRTSLAVWMASLNQPTEVSAGTSMESRTAGLNLPFVVVSFANRKLVIPALQIFVEPFVCDDSFLCHEGFIGIGEKAAVL